MQKQPAVTVTVLKFHCRGCCCCEAEAAARGSGSQRRVSDEVEELPAGLPPCPACSAPNVSTFTLYSNGLQLEPCVHLGSQTALIK